MTSDHEDGRPGPGFDAVLRGHRRSARLTQDELAALAGIGVRTVRDLERGRAHRPQRQTVLLLADALGLTGAERDAFLSAARGGANPPVTTPVPETNRLPVAGELIGRDDDVAELVARLSAPLPDGERCISLVGLAGVGKSALSLAVSHRLADVHPGGAGGIVITEGFTAGEIKGAAAAVFRVGHPDDLPVRLAGTSGVLLIDAVERAPDAVAEALRWLLARVPTLRFLATGRHPIGIPAERVWPLAPLVAPPPGTPPTLAAVTAYPAVALFLDRLARVRRAPVEAAEAGPLTVLARRLGGLPLAIELAAARGRVLTLTEILDRYGDRVLDLDGPPGGEVSLRAAVAASYRLLSEAEQRALRRLAMLRYRWSLAVAEQMIDDGTDVVHLLDRLLELGMLGVRGSRTFRFRLLDVVREYAEERAAEEGELAENRRRHAVVMAGLAEQIAPGLVGAGFADAVNRLDVVAGDLAWALTFAAAADPHTALRIAAVLPRWWRFRGRDVTGRQWLRRLLDDPRTVEADPRLRAWAQIGVAQLAREHGAAAEEIRSAQAALISFQRLAVVSGEVTAHTQLAAMWLTTGHVREARRHAEASLDLARRHGRLRDMAVAENNLTWHEIRDGDLPAARRRLAEADRLAARSGETRLHAVAVANLAEVARLEGRPADAILLGRRAVAELAVVGDPYHRRRALATIGRALAESDRLDDAVAVLADLRAAGDVLPDGPESMVEGAIALRRGDEKQAATSFARAAEAYESGQDPRDVVAALVGLAVSTSDPDERAVVLRRLDQRRKAGAITLLPREKAVLGCE